MKCLRRISVWIYDDGSYVVESADSKDESVKGKLETVCDAAVWVCASLGVRLRDLADYALDS